MSKDTMLEGFRDFQHEVVLMCSLSHENLVKFLGIIDSSPPQMVLEYCERPDLYKHIKNENLLPDEIFNDKLKMRFCFDIAKAMKYLHSIPIIHRDLRCPNVFVVSIDIDAPICLKVGDFGLAQQFSSKLESILSINFIF